MNRGRGARLLPRGLPPARRRLSLLVLPSPPPTHGLSAAASRMPRSPRAPHTSFPLLREPLGPPCLTPCGTDADLGQGPAAPLQLAPQRYWLGASLCATLQEAARDLRPQRETNGSPRLPLGGLRVLGADPHARGRAKARHASNGQSLTSYPPNSRMASNMATTFSTGVSSRIASWLAPAMYPPPGFMISRTSRVFSRTNAGVPLMRTR